MDSSTDTAPQNRFFPLTIPPPLLPGAKRRLAT
jgi:hypothetical protein